MSKTWRGLLNSEFGTKRLVFLHFFPKRTGITLLFFYPVTQVEFVCFVTTCQDVFKSLCICLTEREFDFLVNCMLLWKQE